MIRQLARLENQSLLAALLGVVIATIAGQAAAQVRDDPRRPYYMPQVPERVIEIESLIRLMEHPATRWGRVQADLREGTLYLIGTVRDADAPALAERMVQPIAGGFPILNQLEVNARAVQEPERSEGDLVREAQQQIEQHFPNIAPGLHVSTYGETLVVEGVVPDYDTRWALSQVLHRIDGADAVRNVTYVAQTDRGREPESRVSVPIRIGNLFSMDLQIGSESGLDLNLWAAGHPTGVYVDWADDAPGDQVLGDTFVQMLQQDGRVNMQNAQIHVDRGVLFLRGLFASQADRMRAVHLAHRVGFRGLVDASFVPADADSRTLPYYELDDLATYLRYWLATRAGIWRVDVQVENGQVEVRGDALTPFHAESGREAAAALAPLEDLPLGWNLRVVEPQDVAGLGSRNP